MKKIPVLLLSIFLLIGLAACASVDESQYPWELGGKSTVKLAKAEVFLTLVDDTLTTAGASFTLRNEDEFTLETGAWFLIEVKVNGKWRDIQRSTQGPLDALILPSGDDFVFDIDWSGSYGELPAGDYRLIKEFSNDDEDPHENYYVACEFTIS